jgi:hypothetical protein
MEFSRERVEMRGRPEGRSGRAEEQKALQRSPSIQEWKELYDATIRFKQVECWNWMWDSDLFGVQNPESGEVGYCCIMGRAGEHFALAVYLGTEGLEGYQKTQRSGFSLLPFDALLLQRCLMGSFEDRRRLTKRDFQMIKTLGLEFRGRNSWPLFRSYLPGYVPWHLNREEAKFLTVALGQVVDVALRFKDDPEMLTTPLKNQYLVRVPKKDGDGVVWRDEWIEPMPFEKKEIDTEPVDEDLLNGIRRRNLQRQGIWEVDIFYFPQAVQEKEGRPYYPRTILTVDHYSGLVLEYHLAKPENFLSELQEAFLEAVEHVEVIPKELLVKGEESLKLLEPITSGLRIKMRKVKRLPALERAQESLLVFLEDKRFL